LRVYLLDRWHEQEVLWSCPWFAFAAYYWLYVSRPASRCSTRFARLYVALQGKKSSRYFSAPFRQAVTRLVAAWPQAGTINKQL
jgi:hypothetical protein